MRSVTGYPWGCCPTHEQCPTVSPKASCPSQEGRSPHRRMAWAPVERGRGMQAAPRGHESVWAVVVGSSCCRRAPLPSRLSRSRRRDLGAALYDTRAAQSRGGCGEGRTGSWVRRRHENCRRRHHLCCRHRRAANSEQRAWTYELLPLLPPSSHHPPPPPPLPLSPLLLRPPLPLRIMLPRRHHLGSRWQLRRRLRRPLRRPRVRSSQMRGCGVAAAPPAGPVVRPPGAPCHSKRDLGWPLLPRRPVRKGEKECGRRREHSRGSPLPTGALISRRLQPVRARPSAPRRSTPPRTGAQRRIECRVELAPKGSQCGRATPTVDVAQGGESGEECSLGAASTRSTRRRESCSAAPHSM